MKPACVLIGAALLAARAASAAEAPPEQPAVDTASAGLGTTIVGEQESAIGLYLTPWKNETASDMDRPPALLDESLAPINGRSFQRHVEYYETRAAYQRERLHRR